MLLGARRVAAASLAAILALGGSASLAWAEEAEASTPETTTTTTVVEEEKAEEEIPESSLSVVEEESATVAAEAVTDQEKATEDQGAATGEETLALVPNAEEDAAKATLGVSYATHVQRDGWQNAVKDGAVSGTFGRSLRLESIRISLDKNGEGIPAGGIEYRTQIQRSGWLGWVRDGAESGSVGQSLRMEALQIRLYGDLAEAYDVYYRVHIQTHGWMTWAKNGELSGSTGMSKRLEALQIVVVPKGENPPAADPAAQVNQAFMDGTNISASAHVQRIGWTNPVGTGEICGTSGQSLRMEALTVRLSGARVPGGIRARSHVQRDGWQNWVSDGQVTGTTGRSLRLEAIQFELTGEAADEFDLYYRTHVQKIGWLNWAKNGEQSGTAGLSLRLEAVQFVLVNKGEAAPDSAGSYPSSFVGTSSVSAAANVEGTGWQNPVTNGVIGTTGKGLRVEGIRAQLESGEDSLPGGIAYRTFVEGSGWQSWGENGGDAGLPGGGKRIEAVEFKLTGDITKTYSIWYRVHVQKIGWLGWARDGQSAGTGNLSLRVEAVEVRLVPKAAADPGENAGYYTNVMPISGDPELDAMIREFIKTTGTGYQGLRRAYEIISSYPYSTGNRWPGANWESWSIPYAKEMYRNHTGNCYRYASLMCWTARALGYNAKVVPGWIPGRTNPRCDHGWVEVNLDGKIYIIDAEMNGNDGYPEYEWFMIKYADAHIKYFDLNDNRLLLQ